jgi:hypothetical protein
MKGPQPYEGGLAAPSVIPRSVMQLHSTVLEANGAFVIERELVGWAAVQLTGCQTLPTRSNEALSAPRSARWLRRSVSVRMPRWPRAHDDNRSNCRRTLAARDAPSSLLDVDMP